MGILAARCGLSPCARQGGLPLRMGSKRQQVQLGQEAGVRMKDHIKPVLEDLHRLLTGEGGKFEVLLPTLKALKALGSGGLTNHPLPHEFILPEGICQGLLQADATRERTLLVAVP